MPLSLLDISNSLKNAKVCLKVPELDGGHVVEVNGHPVSSSGGYCVVYKYQLANGKNCQGLILIILLITNITRKLFLLQDNSIPLL